MDDLQFETSSLALASKLTAHADVSRVLHETLLRERLLESKLEALYREREETEGSVQTLYDPICELLDLARSDAETLASGVHETSKLSEKVSRKVRELDTAQTCAQATLDQIAGLITRGQAIRGLQGALDAGDLERAARYLEEYSGLQGRREAVPAEDAREEKVLQEAKDRLHSEFTGRLASAREQKNHGEVMRCLKSLSLLGSQGRAIETLIEYLRELVRQRADEDYAALVESSDPDFSGALAGLLGDLAAAIGEHRDFLLSNFGHAAFIQVLEGMHSECNDRGSRLLQRYMQHRSLESFAQQIRTHRGSQQTELEQPASLFDPRQLEGTLEEMLILCQRAEEYTQYILEEAADPTSGLHQRAASENAIRGGPFNTAARELVAHYINLEEYYIDQSVMKGIELDEWTPDALATSMVDDVFFILHKCSQRGLSTGSLQCSSAILGQINAVLAGTLRATLELRWKKASAALAQSLGASLRSEGAEPSADDKKAASALNSLDLSARYAATLQERLQVMAADAFPAPHDRERIQSVLADLSRTAAGLRQLAHRAVDHLCSNIMLQLGPVLEEVDATKYEISEAEFSANEVELTWVERLLNLLVATLQWTQPVLTSDNYDDLVMVLLEKVAIRVEASMHLKRFNQLGGLQLDRNVRTIVSTLSDVTQRTIREKFAKLSQMATLLSLEAVSEVAEVWGEASGVTWRFTDTQLRAILEQRVDFDRNEIAMHM